ncbi:MAG: Purine nucleoside phosphorylase 1 [Bacteroidia bacterium]|nr:MAG: purine nucleoside phosphorylase I [Bacteroidetes bacterium OLB10]MBV6454703.1 Purine nucleoside phosphorylase 1 [Bacteroidia bacterium]MBX3105433.1 purine-nucleoside phosphorylase [Bacteroidota bacterium]MCE7955211.1 purine-nucleoside phosphorylase [Bacteroidetes bacterium CHB6]MCB0850303.1 purine-nucleoside phosphorylase [Bacteroidota bacterium]
MLEKVKTIAEHIKKTVSFNPEVGIILGSGLGGLVKEIEVTKELNYADIPGFPVSTVKGHGSKLIFGKLNGVNVVAMQGRFHYYEGYSMQEVILPVRVMKFLGIKTLILSNASGGVNPAYKVGDLMILDDHINLMGTNPLIGKNEDELGPRFPDMGEPYDKTLIEKAKKIATAHGFVCHTGVYAAVTGPTFETRAEYKYIKYIGADCVGMSTVPENIAARHMGLPVFAISIITDLGGSDHPEVITHEEVLKVANAAEQKMTVIIKELIKE